MRYWIEGRQILIITPDNLLFGNYSEKELRFFKDQIDKGIIPHQMTGVSINYIRKIEKDEKNKIIDIELGKGSTSKVEFQSKQLRDVVFDHLANRINLTAVNPTSGEVWGLFWKRALLIVGISAFLLYAKTCDITDFYISPRGALGLFLTALAKMVNNTVIMAIALLTIISAFLFSRQRMKKLKGVTRLIRT